MPFFLCFHRYSRFYCYFLSANSALGKGAARKRAAKESYIIFAAQFAAHSRKAEYRPAAIPLPQGEYSKKHGKSRAFFTNRARQSPAHAFSFFTITYYFQGRKGVFGEEIKIKAPKTCAFGMSMPQVRTLSLRPKSRIRPHESRKVGILCGFSNMTCCRR